MRVASRHPTQPVGCVGGVTPQPFVFPLRPFDQCTLQMPEDRRERRPVEPAIVVRPPPYRRIRKPRDLLQRLIVPGGGQPPVSDRLPDRLGGLVADRRQEAHEKLPPSILGPPGPKGVAKEVELDVIMLAPPVIVLAVHNLGLLRVKLKTALLQTLPDRFEHVLRLSPALGGPATSEGVPS